MVEWLAGKAAASVPHPGECIGSPVHP